MGLGLASFDAPTGFAVASNSATASLNDRKEFLDDLGLLNRIGRKQDDVRVTDGGVRVAGRHIDTLARQVADRGDGRLALMPTAAFVRNAPEAFAELSASEVPVVNPAPVPRLLGDKAVQYWTLYEETSVVPFQPLDYYLDGTVDVERLRAEFIADAPLVLKSRTGTQGRGIWFYPGGIDAFCADYREGAAPAAFHDDPGRYLLQYAIPHAHDTRVIAAGSTLVAGERRHGSPDTDRSNLSLVETGTDTPFDSARTLLERGAVSAIDPDDPDPAYERALADLHRAVSDRAGVEPTRLHTWVGWDFFVVDPDDDRLSAVPDAVLDVVLDDRYRTADGCYLIFGEGNLSPGSKERYVNALAHGYRGLAHDSAANLFAYGHAISQDRSFEPGVPPEIDRTVLADEYALPRPETHA